MYKRFTLNDLTTIKNNFIQNLNYIIKKEKCQLFNDYLKFISKEWDNAYYFFRWEPIFRIKKDENNTILVDEREKIELILDKEWLTSLNWLVKKALIKKNNKSDQKSIENILLEEFKSGKFENILDKPYIIYDIETRANIDNLKETEFLLAYSLQAEKNKMSYEYIWKEDLWKFVKKLLEFDWYIVGYNNIFFDNPVCIYNTTKNEEDLKILNEKSLDIFVFIRNLTGKRLWLNKVWNALVWIQKTLESWKEWEILYNEYIKTWDEKLLKEFKDYCKNDVRMTALVLLYLMYYKKIFIEWDDISFTIDDLIEKSKWQNNKKEEKKSNKNQSIF